PFMLDGPLAWVAWQRSGLPMDTSDPVDFDLPLGRWEIGGTWGWQCSAGVLDVAAHTAGQMRRKPATAEMSRYTRDRKHHCGLGPHKARDTTLAVVWLHTITWQLTSIDQPTLEGMLTDITHLGKHYSRGYGRVREWQITDGVPDGWRARPLPSPTGSLQGVRPPYHHLSRKVVCT